MTNQPKKTLSGDVRKLPMMPIRDMVIFPHMMTPFVVGRESSVRALEEALSADRKIFLATQHDASVDEPNTDDIYETGTIGNIVQSVKMPDGNIKVLVEGVERARATEVNDVDGFFVATVRTGQTQLEMTPQVEQLMQRVHSLFEQYVKLQQSLNYETMAASVRADEPAKLADTIAANLQLSIEEKQQLLASAGANRIRVVAAADKERLQGEAMALKSNPLLINKIVAEKLSDKIQVMMVPADGKFFFANDVLKSPAQQIFRQEDQGVDPPARPQGGPGGGR